MALITDARSTREEVDGQPYFEGSSPHRGQVLQRIRRRTYTGNVLLHKALHDGLVNFAKSCVLTGRAVLARCMKTAERGLGTGHGP